MTVILTTIPISTCASETDQIIKVDETAVSTEQSMTTASDSSGFSETPTLTIKKGFPEQEYKDFQEIKKYTIEKLDEIGCYESDYTVLDKKKGVFIVHAYGVDILDLLRDCGLLSRNITPRSLYKNPELLSNEIDFDVLRLRTNTGKMAEISAEELLAVRRWEFDDLPERYNIETGEIAEGTSNQSLNRTLIVWKDLWLQMPKYTMENERLKWAWDHPFYEQSVVSENTFQLLPGQKDIGDYNGDLAVSEITEIDFIMKGSIPNEEILEPMPSEATNDPINQKENIQPVSVDQEEKNQPAENEVKETDTPPSQEQQNLPENNNKPAVKDTTSETDIPTVREPDIISNSEVISTFEKFPNPEVSPVQPEPTAGSEHISYNRYRKTNSTLKNNTPAEKSQALKPSFLKETSQEATDPEIPLADLRHKDKATNNQTLADQSSHPQQPFVGETPSIDSTENSISDSRSRESGLPQPDKEKKSLSWLNMMTKHLTADLPGPSAAIFGTEPSAKPPVTVFDEHNHSKFSSFLAKCVCFLACFKIG